MSFQCQALPSWMETSVTPWNDRVCHPSSPFGVIPVPRHWDPENLTSNKWLHNKGWIPDWNDIICYTLE
ncbi:WPE palindromic element domain-containing protein [Wolbachia endosymbiont of Nomada flava]|uniref:WPE palindromic element domain-containing protein n=1 Tax=Wolbachia endosymbiont of Nomada flava TaxID=1854759 RepID=UPI001FE182A7|nr:WPE palindromic element domain-containing protein [Wolbachia endosymbiont of Nomada flava]